MENLKVTFYILENVTKIPAVCKTVSGHLVFDARMTLGHKSRWTKYENKAPETEWSVFSGVVSRESSRILLTYSALNDLPACTCYVHNSYLQNPSSEKHCVVFSPEFGIENVGKH